MKNVVITGATSFIGLNLIEQIANTYNIFAIVRKDSPKKNLLLKYDNVKIIELNMDCFSEISKLIGTKCDIFYHLAWDGTRGALRNDEELQKRNVEFSKMALSSAYEIGCKTFVTAGSQAEYGIQDELTKEEAKCKPNTAYGQAKYEFYLYAKDFCEKNDIRFFEPRIFSTYGIGDYEKTLVMSALDKMTKNEPLELSVCTQLWNFLYIKDVVAAIKMLTELDIQGGAYNIASDDTRPLKEFIYDMHDVLHSQSVLEFKENPDGTVPAGINPDISKIKSLGWKPKYTFLDGIYEMIGDVNSEKD